jgi:pimeloyl-ACP methyl ester carboxylesterase
MFCNLAKLTGVNNMQATYAELTNGRIHYSYEGLINDNNAPLIVFIAGMGDALTGYDTIANTIMDTKKYRLLRFDKWGCGKSDNPSVSHDGEVFVDLVSTLLKYLEIDTSFTLIGHSMGGAIACLFANKYPHLVTQLVLITPAGLQFTMPKEASLLRYVPQFIAQHMVVLNSAKNFPMTSCEVEIAQVGKHVRRTLILWAEQDTLISPVEALPLWRNHFPNATILAIRNCGHNLFFQDDKPITSSVIIREFIKGGDITSIKQALQNITEVKPALKAPKEYQTFWNGDFYRDILL